MRVGEGVSSALWCPCSTNRSIGMREDYVSKMGPLPSTQPCQGDSCLPRTRLITWSLDLGLPSPNVMLLCATLDSVFAILVLSKGS